MSSSWWPRRSMKAALMPSKWQGGRKRRKSASLRNHWRRGSSPPQQLADQRARRAVGQQQPEPVAGVVRSPWRGAGNAAGCCCTR